MNRIVLAGASALALAASSFLAYRIGQGRAVSAPIREAASAPAASPVSSLSQSKPITMRARVREAIERAPVQRSADLARFPDSLEARARTQGAVTALEVEPGIAMIQRYSQDPDDVARFSERMQRVQESFARQSDAGAAGSASSLEGLLERMKEPRDDSHKQALIREYLEHANQLSSDEQDLALERLNVAHGAGTAAPDLAALDTLYRAIEMSIDEPARQDLIREYIELVSDLPDEERDERLAQLNAYYGRAER